MKKALENSGIAIQNHPCDWHAENTEVYGHLCVHSGLQDFPKPQKTTFAFIRHPFACYQSLWCYKMKKRWSEDFFDKEFQTPVFADFVQKLIERSIDGMVHDMFRNIATTVDGRTVDIVGRQERLEDDLVAILRSCGEEFSEALLRATPRANTASFDDEWKDQCLITPELSDRIYKADRWIFDTFGYTPEDPHGFSLPISPFKEIAVSVT